MPRKKKNKPRGPRPRPQLVVTLAPDVIAEVRRRAGGAPSMGKRPIARIVEDALREAFQLPEIDHGS
jgi:hypothetical protein